MQMIEWYEPQRRQHYIVSGYVWAAKFLGRCRGIEQLLGGVTSPLLC